jgi:hypothetical protein
MELLKIYVMSQLPYKAQIEAENQPQHIHTIADLITSIQQAVKTLLGVNCLPLRHVYGSRPAGLACPNASWVVINNSMISLSRLHDSCDETLKSLNLHLQTDYQSKINNAMENIRSSSIFDGSLAAEKLNDILHDDKKCKSRRLTQELRHQCISKWYDMNTGVNAGATIVSKSIVSKSALEYGPHLTESQFKAFVQIRSGCVNLRTRPHQRKMNDNNINCRLCNRAVESIGHVLGECEQLSPYIIKRHDAIVNILYKHLTSIPNTNTMKENLFHVGNRALKPDLVHFSDSRIVIVDPTVRIEKDMETRESQVMEKFQKYVILGQQLAAEYRLLEQQIIICPLWLGARGTILRGDWELLEQGIGKVPKCILDEIALEIVSWSSTIYNNVALSK